jgi:hypothetical protein
MIILFLKSISFVHYFAVLLNEAKLIIKPNKNKKAKLK